MTRAFLRGLRFLGNAIIAAVVLFCSLLLLVRFVIFPNIGEYREPIAARLSSALGAPVVIGGLDAGWDGWNPRLIIADFAIHDRNASTAAPALRLPRVELVVAWTSLAVLDLRLKELSIERPQLAVRRDRQGRLHVAGLALDTDAVADDTRFIEWLLRQRQLVVIDALLIWEDELRNAPQLVLDNVMFRVERSFSGHRFRLVGVPPADLAAPIDFRGEVTGSSFGDWRTAKGRFYVRLDFADVGLWRNWIPALRPVDSGKGAIRMWFDFADGMPTTVVADVELSDVRTQFADDLPRLDLAHLLGRLEWTRAGSQRELVGHDLSFRMRDGQALAPVDFRLALTEGAGGEITGGDLSFDRVDVAPLGALATHLPLSERWRQNFSALALRGSVTGGRLAWKGTPDAPQHFSASGSFTQFGIAASAAAPGAAGVSGSFDFDQARGELKLDSKAMSVSLPRVFAEPLQFNSASGRVGWTREDGQWRVSVSDLNFVAPHTSGSAKATWQSDAKGPGRLELQAQLGGGEAQNIWHYLPTTLEPGLRDWLRLGIKAGTASDVRIALAGNLADFPFADASRGSFLVNFKVEGATLDYADGWPELTGIDGSVRFEGAGMLIEAERARAFGAQLGPVTAQIADLGATVPLLRIAGKAAGPTGDLLRFIDASPVRASIGDFITGNDVSGAGDLVLAIDLPLGSDDAARVAGSYRFIDNQVSLPGVPKLAKVNGTLSFTDSAVEARDIAAEALGGTMRIGVASDAGGLRVTAEGSANLATLRSQWDLPLLERISGVVGWRFASVARDGHSEWTLESDLKGADVVLPAPIGKSPDQAAPLRVHRGDVVGKAREDLITVDYRGFVRAILHRTEGRDGRSLDRALVQLGPEAPSVVRAERPGVWIRGRLADLDVDEWLALNAKENPQGRGTRQGGGVALEGVDLATERMEVFGRLFHDLKVVAQRGGDGWRLRLSGREVEGTAVWTGPSTALPDGHIISRLSRFQMPDPKAFHPARSEIDPNERDRITWPKLDIVADALISRGHDLGKFEFLAQPVGSDWRINKLALTNPDGRIDASGWWRVGRDQQTTKLDIELNATDAGLFLQRFGYPVAVRKAPSTIRGGLEWAGAPNNFDYPTLSGDFRLETGAGQFTKIDPGLGKLLGVLSLQALPRRITLDFSDVFSEGFAFDSIAGDFRIQRGQMHTDNLRLEGAAASVRINGDIDLAAEQQMLNVRVQPALSASVSAGAAAIFIANPLVGAAIGAGALLAQTMLDNPIDRIFSYDYRVTGGWSDPQVERVTAQQASGVTGPGGETPTR